MAIGRTACLSDTTSSEERGIQADGEHSCISTRKQKGRKAVEDWKEGAEMEKVRTKIRTEQGQPQSASSRNGFGFRNLIWLLR